ncbi:MAG: LysM peptidoglycan-binding domain-containing protein, partial [Chloroflexales bacterium]
MIIVGDALGRWSIRLSSPDLPSAAAVAQVALSSAGSAGQIIPVYLVPRMTKDSVALGSARAEPIAPAQSTPREITDAFREVHYLIDGETLGDLADRYGVSVGSIIWSNGLDSGDALIVGQPLRIPRVSGAPHIVAEGETVAVIAGSLRSCLKRMVVGAGDWVH